MKKILYLLLITPLIVYQQIKPDKIIFREYVPGFYENEILKDAKNVEEKISPPKVHKILKLDYSNKDLPNKFDLYKTHWHFKPISQGNAGTCWAFSTISFFESEVYRITKQQIKLSEIYIVYWEYVEKVKEYVRTKGNSLVDEGSESNAVTRIIKQYGCVPAEQYTGLLHGRKYHDHSKMKEEITSFLKWVKESNCWNEEFVVSTVKLIMNSYIGEPPSEVVWKDKKYTPKQFSTEILKINPDDYVDILSYMQEPFYKKVIYDVPDNWWKSKDYYNVPLEEFNNYLRKAIENGYTVAIGGDVSEAGFDTKTQCATIPNFDIPSQYINDEARQFRFSNKTTTDDHGMHIVGYTDYKGQRWYLVKDSSAGSRNNDPNSKEFGYYFMNEDYVKLKIMYYTVHKDAVKDLLNKFSNP